MPYCALPLSACRAQPFPLQRQGVPAKSNLSLLPASQGGLVGAGGEGKGSVRCREGPAALPVSHHRLGCRGIFHQAQRAAHCVLPAARAVSAFCPLRLDLGSFIVPDLLAQPPSHLSAQGLREQRKGRLRLGGPWREGGDAQLPRGNSLHGMG